MLRLRFFVGAIVVFSAAVQAQTPIVRSLVPGVPAGVTAFVDVTVVPMDTERVLLRQTVLVEGGWITVLGPTSEVPIPAGAVRIDGQGKYLIPGLAEMHGHIRSAEEGKKLSQIPTPQAQVAEAERQLFLLAAHGITTVRSMNAYEPENLGEEWIRLLDGARVMQLRARAAAGELWSPRIYTSGQWAPTRYFYNVEPLRPKRKVRSNPPLDSVAAFVAAYKAAGYDFLKIRLEPPELFDSVMAAARRVGIPVVGHAPQQVPLEKALGMRSIEHPGQTKAFNPYRVPPPDTNGWGAKSEAAYRAATAATRRAGTWLCVPNLGDMKLVKYMYEAGVGLLLGTDAARQPFEQLAKAPHKALQELVEIGLTPYQALITGTKNVATFFGTLDSVGTVAVGKRADLVLLQGNPLQDIRATEQIAGVMLGGRWLGGVEREQRLARGTHP